MKQTNSFKQFGFTIVELLIVIVVIAILAAIVIVAYNGIQTRAKDTRKQSDIKQVQKLVEAYNAEHGEYPVTASNIQSAAATTVRSDANCYTGTQQEDWVPGVGKLPQSKENPNKGVTANSRGCYMYASDGLRYVISAWNNIESGPRTDTMYRRLGFREMGYSGSNMYYCNHPAIGGTNGGVYSAARDYYKFSYTISNITNCNETPPSGA